MISFVLDIFQILFLGNNLFLIVLFLVLLQMVKLVAFDKFDNTAEALEAVAKLLEGTPSKGLRKFLKANCVGETLAVADSKLGNIIKEKLVCVLFRYAHLFLNMGCFLQMCFTLVENRLCSQQCCYGAVTRC